MLRFTRAFLSYGFLALALLLLSPIAVDGVGGGGAAYAKGDKAKKIKAPKAKKRPSLSFRPEVSRQSIKYAGKVGVLHFRDRRGFKFFGGSDEFFAEPTMEALNNALYLGVKSGRAFAQVVEIPMEPKARITRDELKIIAGQYGVDYILLNDLTIFTMLREKIAAKKKGLDFTIKVRFGVFSQLIDPQSGAILWAEPVVREMGQLNAQKKVKANAYGDSARAAVKAGLADMSASIHAIGLEVRQ